MSCLGRGIAVLDVNFTNVGIEQREYGNTGFIPAGLP